MAKVELKNLFKTYNKKIEALHDINFTIEDGQFFVLLGPSGAGKTTTLRCIAGLEKIDSGSVLFNDESVTEDILNRPLVPEVLPGKKAGLINTGVEPPSLLAEIISFNEPTRKEKRRAKIGIRTSSTKKNKKGNNSL